jgi:hypothetical protein
MTDAAGFEHALASMERHAGSVSTGGEYGGPGTY